MNINRLCLLIILLFAVTALDLSRPALRPNYSDECPRVSVTCSDVTNDFTATFVANVYIGTTNEPIRYKWTVSGGKVVRGQGTSSIDVKVDGTAQTVTATVEVTGFPKVCKNKASCSTRVVPSKYPKQWWYWVSRSQQA